MVAVRIRDIPLVRYFVESRIVQKIWNSRIIRKVRGVHHVAQQKPPQSYNPAPLNHRIVWEEPPRPRLSQRLNKPVSTNFYTPEAARPATPADRISPVKPLAPQELPCFPLSTHEYLTPDDLHMLEPVVEKVASDWETLFLYLFPSSKSHLLFEIREDYSGDCVQACRVAMERWLQFPGVHTIGDIYRVMGVHRFSNFVSDLKEQNLYSEGEPEREKPQPVDESPHEYSFSVDGSLGVDDVDDLMVLLEPAIHDWQTVCLFLPGISQTQLHDIQRQYPHQSRECLREALSGWLQSSSRHMSEVIEALNLARFTNLAKEIREQMKIEEKPVSHDGFNLQGLSLDSELTLDHLPLLEVVAGDAAVKWDDIMIHLFKENHTSLLKEIDQKNSRVSHAFREALYEWLAMSGSHTLGNIVEALDANSFHALAGRLRKAAS